METKEQVFSEVRLVEGEENGTSQIQASTGEAQLKSDVKDGATQTANSEASSPELTNELETAQKILGDRFEVQEFLGNGGMGAVFKVFDRKLEKTFAAKLLSPKLLQDEISEKRFEKEAKTAQRLTHAHLAAVYESLRGEGNIPFLIMDYLPGKNLAQLLETEQSLNSERALEIFQQLADALAYVHSVGLVHRDIKPSNIMVSNPSPGIDLVKLLDFGIAKVVNDRCVDLTAEYTQTRGFMGSAISLSPEQCKGEEATFASDIFSLGCVMYKTITGVHPFEGKSIVQTTANVLANDPAPFSQYPGLKQVPSSLEQVILRCLSKKPEDRYQSASELKADLLRVQKAKKLPPSQQQKNRQKRWQRTAVTMFLAGALSFGAVSLVVAANPIAKELVCGYAISLGDPQALGDRELMVEWATRHMNDGHYQRAIELINRSFGYDSGHVKGRDPYGLMWMDTDAGLRQADKEKFAGEAAAKLLKLATCFEREKNLEAAEYYYRQAFGAFTMTPEKPPPQAVEDYANLLRLQHRTDAANSIEEEYRASKTIRSLPELKSQWKPD